MAMPQAASLISVEGFQRYIGNVARQICIQRMLNNGLPDRHLSTDAQMEDDWHQACVFWAAHFIAGRLELGRLEAGCYPVFEHVWLEEVKEYFAYCNWIEERGPERLSSEVERQNDYFSACDEIRRLLYDSEIKQGGDPTNRFQPLQYLCNQYLDSNRNIDLTKLEPLIEKKTQRIVLGKITEPTAARVRANSFVRSFYENIGPAIEGHREKTRGVLLALQMGSAPHAGVEIINSLEAAMAILLLDPEHIRDWLGSGFMESQSVF
jgi:hypothetical protein